jgi:hypothetical protein
MAAAATARHCSPCAPPAPTSTPRPARSATSSPASASGAPDKDRVPEIEPSPRRQINDSSPSSTPYWRVIRTCRSWLRKVAKSGWRPGRSRCGRRDQDGPGAGAGSTALRLSTHTRDAMGKWTYCPRAAGNTEFLSCPPSPQEGWWQRLFPNCCPASKREAWDDVFSLRGYRWCRAQRGHFPAAGQQTG